MALPFQGWKLQSKFLLYGAYHKSGTNQTDKILVYITGSNITINTILRQVAPPTLYPITLSILIVLSSNSHSLFRIFKYTTKKMMDAKYYLILMWRVFLYHGILKILAFLKFENWHRKRPWHCGKETSKMDG